MGDKEPDQSADTQAGPSTGALRFVAAVRKKVYDNAVSTVAAAVVVVVTAIILFVWDPMKSGVENKLTDLKNITNGEALRVARGTVGSRTIWAIPFRNRDDDSQYIAVWYETDYRNDPCESEAGGEDKGGTVSPATPDWCDLGLGPIALDILVGGDGTYERQATHVTSGTSAGGMDPDYLATITKAYGAPLQRYWGIVDRDGDGKKEVLSIADSAGTAPTLPIYVTLFETSTSKVRQLRSYPSRFSVRNEFVNVDTGGVRAWLITRLKEFRQEPGDLCKRDLAGKLACTESASFQQEQKEEAQTLQDLDYEWRAKNEENWIAGNGVDFTTGPIKLTWTKGRFDSGQDCVVRMGSLEWHNVFKGPLVVNDLAMNRKAVVYLQDGDHHREIPTIVAGKRYLWLALIADRQILAIDPVRFEVKRFAIPEFEKGIPVGWSVPGESPEFFSEHELKATKEFQLDGLQMEGNRLVYDRTPLTLGVRVDEFVGAKPCLIPDIQ